MRDYLFLDISRLQLFLDQIEGPSFSVAKISKKISISARPSFEYSRESGVRLENVHEKIERLIGYLGHEKRLGSRPARMPGYMGLQSDFVLEQTLATKVIVPSDALGSNSRSDIVVWVSEPDVSTIHERTGLWDFTGTFLYLVERPFDEGSYTTVYSGCSALQTIANAAVGRPLLTTNHQEPMGRWNNIHPLEKLLAIGGKVMDERKIETLYRIRYITNEQCFVYEGNELRLNDLLGYPLYMAVVI